VATIQILLVNMPRLLAEIVHTIIAPHHDLHAVADLTGAYEQVTAELRQVDVDVVILSIHKPESALLLTQLLETRPATRVLVVGGDGRQGFVCEPVGELSPASLLDAIRGSGSPA
jgi:DNA-binding NarL/FixJ family response regulator